MSDKDKQPLAASAQTPEAESADAALRQIVDGFLHFHHEVFPQQEELFKKLATAQAPKAMFITCADSRIVPELITHSSPGDLFVTRNVGNVVPPYGQMNGGVSTAIEYAVLALGVQHIIICGHSDCGAMRAVLNPDSLEKCRQSKPGCATLKSRKPWCMKIVTAPTKRKHADPHRGKRHRPIAALAYPSFGSLAHGERSFVHPWLGLRHRNQRNQSLRRGSGTFPAARRQPSDSGGDA